MVARSEAVETCPCCGSENVYPDWQAEKQGYVAVCENCGVEIMLCNECLHADDNQARRCDWHTKIKGRSIVWTCFRRKEKENG